MDKLFAFLLLVCGVYSVDGACPSGFVSAHNSCFKVMYHTSMNWIDSRDTCALTGSTLVKIDSAEKQAHIQDLLNSTLYKDENSTIRIDVWIDSGDFLAENEFRWFYEDGRSEINHGYTNFSPNEPNNQGYAEHCLLLHYDGHKGLWSDYRCDQRKYFICEKSDGNDGMNAIIG